ncbi:MAG: translation initiation factor IF-2 [Patescibacteria group bacterium]|jgi:translation initiation factor IF-2
MENIKATTTQDTRAPIVTVMGHVDHGKTSILDAIRKTNVQGGEYAGITQHIGAYQVQHKDHKITFIDTPGHAAFTQMRARGGRAADVVVLVVAADEGVKPQTKEAISHAKASGCPIIVAFNKVDLASANVQKAKQELAQESVLLEDWGGDVVGVEVSAKTGQNLEGLLDSILAVADLLELKADKNGELEAVIIESRLDMKKGVVVSCIVKNGTLRIGDKIYASGYSAKVRSIMDDKGAMLKEAGPAQPIEVSGFSKVPNVGDLLVAEGSDLSELAIDENRVEIVGKETKRTVSIIIKADTQGTLEAVKAGLASLVAENVGASYSLRFLHTATGDINDSDILLAQGSGGIIVGFDVKIGSSAKDLADNLRVVYKTYKTIYELTDDAKTLLEGTAFDEEKKIKGRAKIIKTFKLPSGDVIAGCLVMAGALKENSRIAIYDKDPSDVTDEDEPIYRGAIRKLKMGKNEVPLVGKDVECGALFRPQFEGLEKDQYIEVM